MKQKRYSVEQIIAVLKQAELGASVGDIVRKLGISEQTFYRWKKKYGGLEPSQARELKSLRDENTQLKKLVANLSLDKAKLTDVVKKSGEAVAASRHGGVSEDPLSGERAACLPSCGGGALGASLSIDCQPSRPATGSSPRTGVDPLLGTYLKSSRFIGPARIAAAGGL
jgi:putative transposase